MNRIGFALSGIMALIGINTLLITRIANTLMPKIGYVAFQTAMKGSYSAENYRMSFSAVNTAAGLLLVVGIGGSAFFLLRERKEKEAAGHRADRENM